MDLKLQIPDHLRDTVTELFEKAESTGIDHYRVYLCAWLLVVARNRPESYFPRGKNVPMPSYLLAGALHGINNGDEHPEDVAQLYARGRRAGQRVQAAAKAAWSQFDKVFRNNRLELPVSTREEAQQALSVLKRFVAYADPGEDLLKRARAKDEHEVFSSSSLALLWWRYYLHSPRTQYWRDMFSLAKIWGVTSGATLASFVRGVRELTESNDQIPTPPFIPGARCPLS